MTEIKGWPPEGEIAKIRTYFPEKEKKQYLNIFNALTRFFAFIKFKRKEKEKYLFQLLEIAYEAGRHDAYSEITFFLNELRKG